ncbi:MAG TPA: histidine kinase [Puia sp.]|uniref:sensor histidine kinase n=1 Tax=Puia sp. TaxID=2045100 RepID=UPI002C99C040|nr:histidine kinase [Puia sp.]HVU95388.1 histidine kinase [Puia sp.]
MAKAPLSQHKFLLIFLSWWAIWAFLQVSLLIGFGLSARTSLIDSLVSNTLVALSCGFLSNNMQYYLPKKERYWYILLISLSLSAIILLACKAILVPLLSEKADGAAYAEFFSKSWPVRFDIVFLQVGCMAILSVLWYSSEEEQENRQRRNDAERLAREAELFKLRQQLAPHFLFNSLNSISALIGSRPEQARKMIQQLSDFLRGNLKKEDQQWVPLSEELQYLELYLDIEKVRFGHRLDTQVTCGQDCMSSRIPPMLLQPIVENAIKFGLYDTTDAVTIAIRAKVEAKFVIIEVENPFDPETSRPKKGTGFGLSSIQRRLYLLFARTDLLETRVTDNLFTTIVRIPQLENIPAKPAIDNTQTPKA